MSDQKLRREFYQKGEIQYEDKISKHNLASKKYKLSQPSSNHQSNLIINSQSRKINNKIAYCQDSKVCTKFNHCEGKIYTNIYQGQFSDQDSYFSCDSDLLKDVNPRNIDTVPQIQLTNKPQIDQLINANLKVNKFLKLYDKIQKQEQQKLISENLKKVDEEARKALLKSKTRQQESQKSKPKWGHQMFINTKNEQQQQKQQKNHSQENDSVPLTQNKKKDLKPIEQRIKQYKDRLIKQQEKRTQQENALNSKHRKLNEDQLKNTQKRIVTNALNIMKDKDQQIKLMKQKQEQVKEKIKKLQQQSLKNVSKCKKKPVPQEGQQGFYLGQSQYSTFQARQEGRKIIKKPKAKKGMKNVPDSNFQNNVNAKQQSKVKNYRNFPTKSKSNLSKTNPQITKKNNSKNENQMLNNQQKQNFKGKFYVWNIPIEKQDYQAVTLSRIAKQQDMSKNKKVNKTFREEANQFLHQKALVKMHQQQISRKQQQFIQKVQAKKMEYIQQYQNTYERIQA